MQTGTPPETFTDRRERFLVVFAGGMLLWVILAGFGVGPLLHQVPTNGSFADSAAAFSAGERQYRFAAAASLMVTLSGVVLAFALYELLRRVNRSVALIALIFFLLDSVLGLFERATSFLRLDLFPLYTRGLEAAPRIAELIRIFDNELENVGGIFFAIGSALFFVLFMRSRFLPTLLAALGFGASTLFALLYFTMLVIPEQRATFQTICFVLLALAYLSSGSWLIMSGIRSGRGKSFAGTELIN